MRESIQVRRCKLGDESALALIGQATFLETFAGVLAGEDIISHCSKAHSRELYREWLQDPRYGIWLAEVAPGDAPVGYMVSAPSDLPLADLSSADVELKRIYILGKFQGGGLGRRFFDASVAYAGEVNASRLLLGVYAQNHAAIGFYQRMGFAQVGTRTFHVGSRYYDDWIMGLSLNS